MNEMPRILHGGGRCILCRKSFIVAKEKINVSGKRALDISALVKHAANVDLSVCVECEKLAICRTNSYNRLVRFKNALHKVDEIRKEIQSNFQGDVPLRFKVKKLVDKGVFQYQERRLYHHFYIGHRGGYKQISKAVRGYHLYKYVWKPAIG